MTKPIEAFDIQRDFVDDKDYDFYEVDRNSLEPHCLDTLRGPGLLHSGFLSSKPSRMPDFQWDRRDWYENRYNYDRYNEDRRGLRHNGRRGYDDRFFVPYQIGMGRSNDDQENWGQYGGYYGGYDTYYKDRNDYYKSINHWRLADDIGRSSYGVKPYHNTNFDYHNLGKNRLWESHRYGYGSWKRGRWNSSGVSSWNNLDYGESNYLDKPKHHYYDDRNEDPSGKDCSSRRRPGMSLGSGAIRRSLIAHNVVECEAACFGEREFKCVSYSYRYSSSRGTDNCFLSERPYRGLELSADSGSDVYAMPQDQGCSTISHKPWVESECFWHVRSGAAVSGAAVRGAITVAGLGACEAECIRAHGFFCRGFSFRFDAPTIGDDLENCILTSSPPTSLETNRGLRPTAGHELYSRGNYGRGCEPALYDDTQHRETECYLQYDSAARLKSSAVRGSARVRTEEACGVACTDAPFRCLSFSFNNKAPPDIDNCLLSEIRLFDLQRGVDYEHSVDDWLFAFDLFNGQCWRKVHGKSEYDDPSHELPRPLSPTFEDHPTGPGRPGYLPSGGDLPYAPTGPPSGPGYKPGYVEPEPPSKPGYLEPSGPNYKPGYPEPSGPGFKPPYPEPSGPSYLPEPRPGYPVPSGPGYKPGYLPEHNHKPDYRPSGPDYPEPGYKPGFRPEPSGPSYLPEPGYKPGFRPEPSGPGFKPGYPPDSGFRPGYPPSEPDYKPGYLPHEPRPEYGPPKRPHKPVYPNDREDGLIAVSWRHYTVSGFPCRSGTSCAQNQVAGHWACEPEGGEVGSWDYCCAPTHRCGYSEGFHKPWCYVGPTEDQWRPCSEKYYPYHQHNTPHPSQGHREDQPRPYPSRPWRGKPPTDDRDGPFLGPYLSENDRKYWDSLYKNGPQAYYDKYGNPLPGYTRVPTASRPHIKYRHSYPRPPSGYWVPVSPHDPQELDPPLPGGLGVPRYWPVAYLHKGPPPNITYFRYNETTTTERYEPLPPRNPPRDNPPSRDPVKEPPPASVPSKEPPPSSVTNKATENPNIGVEGRSHRDEKTRNLQNDTNDDIFRIDIDKLTTTTTTTTTTVKPNIILKDPIIPENKEEDVIKTNNSIVEMITPENVKEDKVNDNIKGIDDKLNDFSSIEVFDIEDAKKGDKLSDLKTLEAEERQIEAIGRLLASRRGSKLVLEKRSQKDLEAKNIAIDKDLVDFNFGNKFPTPERRGVIQRVTKDEIEREKYNDKSLEVSETTFVRPPRILSTTENIRKAIVNGKVFYDATIREQRDIFANNTRKAKSFKFLEDSRAPSILNNTSFGKKKIIMARNVNPVRRVRRVYRKRYNPGEVRRRLLEREKTTKADVILETGRKI
ncbi:uncharacterized protein LOC113515941 isoform X1 [Galleria mellonella]|uniref:Uncharacterized protein LOC113515941 isoform X1 n=1 Tax=Galleria mellonella TaxID=7137 RepID=A0ABM3MT18_GALME|nr:uncharacterized protein LOC113515941 isoform X1 [Galleria mellonella]